MKPTNEAELKLYRVSVVGHIDLVADSIESAMEGAEHCLNLREGQEIRAECAEEL